MNIPLLEMHARSPAGPDKPPPKMISLLICPRLAKDRIERVARALRQKTRASIMA